MHFKFSQYTEITDYVFRIDPSRKNQGYIRFFICPDVNDFWLVRILEGFNEEYEKESGSYILERERIPMDRKGQNLQLSKLKRIILEDDGGNWDMKQGNDIESLIDMLDGGYGIINRKEINNLNNTQ